MIEKHIDFSVNLAYNNIKFEVLPMKIYMDVCSYNRPFDNQEQDRIYLEAEVVLSILNHCHKGGWTLIGSNIIDFEVSKMTNPAKKEKVMELCSIASERVLVTAEIEKRAVEIQQIGIKPLDSFHIACAESAGTDIFLTTDDKLIKLSSKISLKVKVENPLNWVAEVL
ncbi:MAG: PIN domain-containing protein [Syntrophomonadaceae bacterium]|nr:PIN domain-containing protein [Syntrophomonadaceae bacterium]